MTLSGLKIFFLHLPRANGHAKLTYPQPRDPSSNGGNKSGPCGPVAKSAVPVATFKAGDNITIQWTETVNHPGRFLFAISSNEDQTFQNFATYIDDQNTSGSHTYAATYKLPDVACDNCTLQLIQSMEENPSAPTYYYSCADIKITKSSPSEGSTNQSNNSNNNSLSPVAEGTKFGGGCGTLHSAHGNSGKTHQSQSFEPLLLFLLPMVTWIWLRKRLNPPRQIQ